MPLYDNIEHINLVQEDLGTKPESVQMLTKVQFPWCFKEEPEQFCVFLWVVN